MKQLISKSKFRYSLLLAACIVSLAALVVALIPQASKSVDAAEEALLVQSSDTVTVRAADRGNSRISLQDGRDLEAVYTGKSSLKQYLQRGLAQPLGMAAGDFDGDGLQDLVVGYSSTGSGIVALHRANPEAFTPRDPETIKAILEKRYPSPFLRKASVFDLPESPDFIGAGDFDMDGHQDVVAGRRGGDALYLMSGDGKGGLSEAMRIQLPALITSMVVGEFNQPDGIADVLVGVSAREGAQVLVYQGRTGALNNAPMAFAISSEATALALGQLNDDPAMDLAVAAGNDVLIFSGRSEQADGATAAGDSLGVMETLSFSSAVKSLVIGEFVWDREGRSEIAALTEGGGMQIVRRGDLDMRPYTEEETEQIKRARIEVLRGKKGEETLTAVMRSMVKRQGKDSSWEEEGLSLGQSGQVGTYSNRAASPSLMAATNMSMLGTNDLLVVDSSSAKLHIVETTPTEPEGDMAVASEGNKRGSGKKQMSAMSLDVHGAPVAVLAMKLNIDTRPDIVILRDGEITPSAIVTTQAGAGFIVDRTDDNASAAAQVCDDAIANDCSLRGAIIKANNTAGDDMITFAASTNGVPIRITLLNPDNVNSTGEDLEAFLDGFHPEYGDFDIADNINNANIDGNLVIMGNGIDTTIVEGGTSAAAGIDRVFDVNNFVSNGTAINVTFSGMTIRHGRSKTQQGVFLNGGGLVFDGFDSNGNTPLQGDGRGTLTLSNVKVTNNQSSGTGGGIHTISASVVINSTSEVSSNHSVNSAGGGMNYAGGNTIANGQNLQISSTTFTNNTTAAAITGNGGGIAMQGGASASISGSTFSNNLSAATDPGDGSGGGGIAFQNVPNITISNTTITGNNARNNGGGLWVSARNPITNAVSTITLSGVTISNNTADADNNNAGKGGGIYNFFSQMTVNSNSSITGNAAHFGGGVFNTHTNNSNDPAATFNMTGGSITNNQSKTHGGGIAGEPATVAPSVGPRAGTITLSGVTLTGNDADSDNNNTGDGGAIYNRMATLNISGTSIIGTLTAGQDNSAVNGGGIASVDANSTTTVTGGSINGNNAKHDGGGVYINLGTFTLDGVTLRGNDADSDNNNDGDGGAIFRNNGTLTLSNLLTIGGTGAGEANRARNGGGIYNLAGTLSITSDSIIGNIATNNGGGLHVDGGTVTALTSTITNNSAANGGGAASGGGILNIDGGVIRSNTATGIGGGLFVTGTGTINLLNNPSIGAAGQPNNAANGGGIGVSNGSLTYTGVAPAGGTIIGNTATAGGGGLFINGGTATLSNLTVTGNSAVSGGGFFVSGGTLNVSLSRIINNTATNGSGAGQNAGTATMENNWWGCDDFPNGTGCQTTTGAVDSDPRIDLKFTPSPATVALGGTSTVTATLNTNTNNQSINPFVMNGLPVTFAVASLGTVSPTSGTITNLMAATTFTANATTCGVAMPSATVDNGTQTANITIQCNADLAVTKTDTPETPSPGDNITYTINFVNNGPSNSTNTTVTDAVPTNTTFVSATVITGTGWTPTTPAVGGTGNVVFSKADVANGETAVFEVVVKVNQGVAHNTIITNNAIAAGDPVDPNNGNNTGTATSTVVVEADLAVQKSDSPDPVIAGNNITYTINFINNGPATATNVTVTDAVPTNTTFVSAAVTTGMGWTPTTPAVGGTGNVVFSKASVPNGETATFQIVVKVNASTPDGTTITNDATAATNIIDPDTTNNTGTATTTVNTQADIAVTKTDSPDPVVAGSNITYTVNFTNNGPSDAQNVTITDAVPANTTFVSAAVTTGSGWTPTTPAVGGTGNVVFSKATVAAGETAVFQIVVNVGPGVAEGTVISNSAVGATTTTDPNTNNNTGSATTNVIARVDLVVTKTDSPDPVFAGNNITYTINFVNNGPSSASTVTVTDAVPANTTFVSAAVTTGMGWGTTMPAVGGTGNVVFSKGTVAPGEMAVFQIVVKVNSSTADGASITNSAVAASATTELNASDNTGAASTTVNRVVDLAVTKTDSPDPVFSGNNITYTINFVNNGPSDASTVTVTDAVPANTTFVSVAVTTGTGWTPSTPAVGGTGNVVFSKADVAAAETAVFQIVVKVDATTAGGTIITNTAVAASVNTDSDSNNNTATATTTVAQQADLAVTKSDSPDPVLAGGNITYTIDFVNNGPSAATSVTVTDAVPADTTFVSAAVITGMGWTPTTPAVGGTGNVVFSKAEVPNGETATFQIVVKVNSNTASGTIIANNALADATTQDPDTTNDMGSATTTVNTQADIAVTKTDSPDPVVAGSNITYTVNFTNNGPSDAQNVTITDAVPANTTFVSAAVTTGSGWTPTTPAGGGTGNVVFSKATVAAGETAVFQIVVNVGPGVAEGTVISNSAVGATTTTDPNTNNNTGSATTNVIARADLAITKSDSPDPVFAGNNLTYTINFVNNGPSNASTVTVSDSVPANTVFVSAAVTTGSGWTPSTPSAGGIGNITFSKGLVAPGETAVFQIVVRVNSNTANGTTISNNATAATATTDPDNSNNTAVASTTVQTRVDFVVTKTDSPDPVLAGNNITYTVTVTNSGPSDASTVTVTDAVPANTTFVSAAVTTGSGWTPATPAVGGTGNVVFSKATVGVGEVAVFQIVVKVDAGAAGGTIITNSAVAASATTELDNSNNTGTATTTVAAQADIAVTKSDSPDPVIAGGNLTYTINFTNNGPSNASTVTVTDAVPANTTFVSAAVTTGSGWTPTTPAVGGTGNVVFSKATVATGETATFQIVVNVNANTSSGTITNSAVGASTTPDPNNANNTGTATTAVNTQADLAVAKTDSGVTAVAGNNLTYTINFVNNGPSDASTVTVTDAVPANTTFVSAAVTTGTGWGTTMPAVGGTGNVVFSKGTVAAGETAVFQIVVRVNSSTAHGATITNSAVAASTTTDPNSANNTGTDTTPVIRNIDLAVTKTDSPDPVIAGNNITYTVNFVNNGPSDASTVTVTDAVPANTTFVSAAVTTGSGWTSVTPAVGGTGNVVFSKAAVTASETAVFQIVVKVNASTSNGATITNSAVAASTNTDTNNSNNTGTATTTVNTQADIAVTKTDSPDPVIAGGNLTYTINFTNNGPSNASTVTVTDAVPANTTFVSAAVTTGSGWTPTTPAVGGTGNVVFSKATVAAGETAVFQMVVKVNVNTPHNTIINNSAVGATTTTDPNSGNNTGTTSTTVLAQADLAVAKSDSPDPACANQNITYTISFANNGPGSGINTNVIDAVPAGTTFVSAAVTSGMGWGMMTPAVGGTGNVVFSKASVANGETAVFQIVVKVNASATSGTVITNSVTASSDVNDPNTGNNTGMTTSTVDPVPPTISCPDNIIATTTAPNGTGKVVTFPNPTAMDNCGIQSTVCSPASGSTFPTGTTTVTCTTTDTAGNTASCSFTVTVFDVCLQDNVSPSKVLLFNSFTGDYIFCCGNVSITGKGTVTKQAGNITLQHNGPNGQVTGKVSTSTRSGNASWLSPPNSGACLISDGDIRNNTCQCSPPVAP